MNGAHAAPPKRPRVAWVGRAIAACAFVLGLAIYAFPAIDGWLAQLRSLEQIQAAGVPVAQDDADGVAGADPFRSKDDPAYAAWLGYNNQVVAGGLSSAQDPWGQDRASGQFGLSEDGVVGSVSVPALGEVLPLYAGATFDHLYDGAAVIAGTSLPLGREGDNCAIAAHRGGDRGMAMFRDIETLAAGDEVVVTTPWERLVYRVVETHVITPDDFSAVAPQLGRDLVTLVTCHPYGSNAQRYVVYCERDSSADSTGSSAVVGSGSAVGESAMGSTPAAGGGGTGDASFSEPVTLVDALLRPFFSVFEPCDSPALVVERWLRIAGLALALVVPLALILPSSNGIKTKEKTHAQK